jgi:hypothetical protein
VSETRATPGAPIEAPHSPQNFATKAFAAPHRGQLRGSGVPHSVQNFPLPEFSKPQLEQRMTIKLELSPNFRLNQTRIIASKI